jgi:SPX domain protein involved in polyphosphate accumulation
VVTHISRSANRFELKYLVPHDSVEPVVRDLDPYVYSDPNVRWDQGYPVRSVYWDSHGWSFFWEKVEGLKQRRKLRVRAYANVDYGFVEIKARADRTLQKRRARLSLDEIHAKFRGRPGETESLDAPSDPVVSEAMYMRQRYLLRPRMAIAYWRSAFFGTYEPDLRVTFDRRIQYHPHEVDIARPFESGPYVVDPRLVVMEIKFNERAPVWLCKLVSRHGLQIIRLSKYCTAVDRAYFGNRLT